MNNAVNLSFPTFKRKKSVFSWDRKVLSPKITLSDNLKLNKRLKMNGLKFLSIVPPEAFPLAFFDPQYRGVLDKMNYGNEGKNRGRRRCSLPQMNEKTIINFIDSIARALIPSGHLFLWIDKFHLCQGFKSWFSNTKLDVVDLVVWNKARMGMGYRTRRVSEYLVILQKHPKRAKGIWKIHNICDVIVERIQKRDAHIHTKPIDLQANMIKAVTNKEDIIIDPAAGSFSVMKAANLSNRNFLGCDING